MLSKVKKYFIYALAVMLVLAFTLPGKVSAEYNANWYTKWYKGEPEDAEKHDGSPHCPKKHKKHKRRW